MEVLIVVMVLAITGAIIIPMMSQTKELVARSGAKLVLGDLEYAQSEAIRRQTGITVAFNTDDESYAVSSSEGILTHPVSRRSYEVSLPEVLGESTLDIYSANFGNGATSVTFSAIGEPVQPSTGEPITSSAAVEIRCQGYLYRVSLTPLIGKARIAKVE